MQIVALNSNRMRCLSLLLMSCVFFIGVQGLLYSGESLPKHLGEDWISAPDQSLSISINKKLDETTYETEKTKLLAQIDVQELRTSIDVQFSCSFTSILPNGPAHQQGILVSDRILRCGKHVADPHFWQVKFRQFMMEEGGGEVVIERDGKQIRYQVPRGHWGVTFNPHDVSCRMVSIYAVDEAKGRPWDDDMLVACISLDNNLALAETALAVSRQKGYDGPLMMAMEALLAYAQLNCDAALSLGLRAVKKIKADHARGFAWQIAKIASVTGRIKTASELIESYKLQEYFNNWQEIKVLSNQLKHDFNQTKSLADIIKGHPILELNDELTRLTSYIAPKELDNLRHKGMISRKLPDGSFLPMIFGPRVCNGKLTMTVKFKPLDGQPAPKIPFPIHIYHWDYQTQVNDGQTLTIQSDGTLMCVHRATRAALLLGKSERIARGEETKVSIICFNGILEIEVDGHRVFVGPLLTPMTKSTSLTWGTTLHDNQTFGAVSWQSIGEKNQDTATLFNEYPQIRFLMKEGKYTEALKAIEALDIHNNSLDWHADRLYTEILSLNQKWKEIIPVAQRWGEKSMEPNAWLIWACANLAIDSSSAKNILKTLKQNVPSVDHWIYSNYIRVFAILMRQADCTKECIDWLNPLEGRYDVGAEYELYWSYLDIEDWDNAKIVMKRLYKDMYRNAKACNRFVEAAVAIRAGQQAPALTEIRDLVDNKRMSNHFIFSLVLWGNEIQPNEMDEKIGTFPKAGLWHFYRGLKAFALHDDKLAEEEFNFITSKHSDAYEAHFAEHLKEMIRLQKRRNKTDIKPPGEWPYSRDSYKPIQLPKPSSKEPKNPLPENANDF